MTRYYQTVVNRGSFTSTEDARLHHAYQLHNSSSVKARDVWSLCAEHVGNKRTAYQCQQRWKQYLNPSLDLTTPWSKKEAETLSTLMQRGVRLTEKVLRENFPNRSRNLIRARVQQYQPPRSDNRRHWGTRTGTRSRLRPNTPTTARTSSGHHECEPEDADDDEGDDDEVQIMLEAPTSTRPTQQTSSSWGPSSATYGGSSSAPASASAPRSPSAPTSPTAPTSLSAPTSPYAPTSPCAPVTPTSPQGKNTHIELARLLFTTPHASLECKVSAGNVLFDHIFEPANGSPERLELAKDLFTIGAGIISPDMLSCVEAMMHEYMLGNDF